MQSTVKMLMPLVFFLSFHGGLHSEVHDEKV